MTAFLEGERFGPETMRVMGLAFEMARAALRLADNADFATQTLARMIIDLAKSGETNPNELCERALAAVRGSQSPAAPTPPITP